MSYGLKMFMCNETMSDLRTGVISILSVAPHEFLSCIEEREVFKSTGFIHILPTLKLNFTLWATSIYVSK